MKFSDLDVGHVVLTKYKEGEYSDVFRVAVLEKSPNSLYLLNEYMYWSKDFDTYRKVWESVEHLDSKFEIVDCLDCFNFNNDIRS